MSDVATCRICNEEKDLDDFYARSNGGHDTRCKPCVRAINNERQKEGRRLADLARQMLRDIA